MTDDLLHDDIEPDDVPLDEDDLLVQRYLDGTLDEEAALQVEFRIDEDDAFAARIHAYESMFAALDGNALLRAAVLWGSETMPAGLVDAAVNSWQPDPGAERDGGELPPTAVGLDQVFGGWRPAIVAFVVADVVLASVLLGMTAVRGPLQILESVVLTSKDIVLFTLANVPTLEFLTWAVPLTAIAALVGLRGVWSGVRGILGHAEGGAA